ncbi:MFS transporter [Microbacteriaceae bacterium VKM Ac-2854]|nr:MFS transporter [Microbacteriaceae bacterium VKM Ac-2854]
MQPSAIETERPPARAPQRNALLVGLSGHAVEWYEFAAYGVVAAYVAGAMFPAADPRLALVATWTAYSVAFFVRPIGGVVLAHLGDRYGRRRALFATVLLMSVATAGMAVVPGYEAIGLAAPIAFVALRMLQGFAVGGEMSSAVAYVTESALDRRGRTRASSVLAAGTFGASVVGAAIPMTLANILTPEAMTEWGWRLLFAAAVPLAVLAMILRHRAPEPELVERTATPLLRTMRTQKRAILRFVGIGLLFNAALSTCLGGYTNDLLLRGMPPAQTLVVTLGTYVALVLSILGCGRLSDRLGLRATLALGGAGMAVAVGPMLLLGSTGEPGPALLGSALFAVPVGAFATPVYRCLAGMFPPAVRVTAGSIAFNTSAALASVLPAASLGLNALGFEHGLLLLFSITLVLGAVTLLRTTREAMADA